MCVTGHVTTGSGGQMPSAGLLYVRVTRVPYYISRSPHIMQAITDAPFDSETSDGHFSSHKNKPNGRHQTHFIGSKHTKMLYGRGFAMNPTEEVQSAPQTSYSWTWPPVPGGEGKGRIRKGGKERKTEVTEGEERAMVCSALREKRLPQHCCPSTCFGATRSLKAIWKRLLPSLCLQFW